MAPSTRNSGQRNMRSNTDTNAIPAGTGAGVSHRKPTKTSLAKATRASTTAIPILPTASQARVKASQAQVKGAKGKATQSVPAQVQGSFAVQQPEVSQKQAHKDVAEASTPTKTRTDSYIMSSSWTPINGPSVDRQTGRVATVADTLMDVREVNNNNNTVGVPNFNQVQGPATVLGVDATELPVFDNITVAQPRTLSHANVAQPRIQEKYNVAQLGAQDTFNFAPPPTLNNDATSALNTNGAHASVYDGAAASLLTTLSDVPPSSARQPPPVDRHRTARAARLAKETGLAKALNMPAPVAPPDDQLGIPRLTLAMIKAIENSARSRAPKFVIAYSDNMEDVLEGAFFVPYANVRIITDAAPLTRADALDVNKILVVGTGRLNAAKLGEGIVVDAIGTIVGTYKDIVVSFRKNKALRRHVALSNELRSIAGYPVPEEKLCALGKAFDPKEAAKQSKMDQRVAMRALGIKDGKVPSEDGATKHLKARARQEGRNPEADEEAYRQAGMAAKEAADAAESTAAIPLVVEHAPEPSSPLRTCAIPTVANNALQAAEAPPKEVRVILKKGTKKLNEVLVSEEELTPSVSEASDDEDDAAAPSKGKKKETFDHILVEPDEFDAEGKPLLDKNGKHTPFRFKVGKVSDDRLVITRKERTTGRIDTLQYPHEVNWNSQKHISALNAWRAQIYRRTVEDYTRYDPRPLYSYHEKRFLRAYWRREMDDREDAAKKANWRDVLTAFKTFFPHTSRSESSISAWCGRDEEIKIVRGKIPAIAAPTCGTKRSRNAEEEEEGAEVAPAPTTRALKKLRMTKEAEARPRAGVDDVEMTDAESGDVEEEEEEEEL